MHIHDLMGWRGPMTHRQFIGWVDWLNRQWDNPNRSDYYMMKMIAVTKAASGQSQSIDDQRILFSPPETTQGDEFSTGWDDEEGDAETLPDANVVKRTPRPEDRIALSPASALSGGKVRVAQPDGSLRMYDVKQQKYLDEM